MLARPPGTAPAELAPPAAPAWPTRADAPPPPVAEPARTCRDYTHRLPRGTCREPVAVGSAGRPYRLTRAEGDAAHADPWTDDAIARFLARVASSRRRGFGEADADDLAERLHLLDLQREGRSLCLSCRHLAGSTATGWRCGNHKAAGMPRELAPEWVTTAMRCPGFAGGRA